MLRAAVCVFAVSLSRAQSLTPAIEHYKLPNGAQVILHVDHKTPNVRLDLLFRAGSKNDPPGRSGIAHLFEHLLGEGLEAGSTFYEAVERLGGTDIGGSTNYDFTEYEETIPSNRLERVLWMESNRLSRFPEGLTQAAFEREREVVRNERRQKVENAPGAQLAPLAHQHAFPPGHAYAGSVVGEHQDLLATSIDDLTRFYRSYYTSDRLSLVIAGDFDPAQVKEWVARYFGWMQPGTVTADPERSTPRLETPKVVELHDRVRERNIVFVWPGPGSSDPEDAAMEVAKYVFSHEWARLNSFIDKIPCKGTGVERVSFLDASLFTVGVNPAGMSLPAIRTALASAMDAFAREGPTQDELDRARNNLEFEQVAKLEDLGEMAYALNQGALYYGSPARIDEWLGRYRKVTAEQVKAAVARWLTANALAIDMIPLPDAPAPRAVPDRTQPPAFQPEKRFQGPAVKSSKLPNGLELFVVERHDMPKVSVRVFLKVGGALDPRGKEGAALLTIINFKNGTASRNADQLDKELSRLAVSLQSSANAAWETTGFDVLTAHLDSALGLLSDMLLHSNFPEDRFANEKKEWLEQFDRPEVRATDFGNAVMRLVFGASHPLGRSIFGTRETLEALKPADAIAFRDRYVKPDVAALVMAGDVTPDQALSLARKHFGEWTGVSDKPLVLPPPQPAPGRVFVIDRKGAAQTMIVQMLPVIGREHQDYPALSLVSHVFGGGQSTSRLFRAIRRDRGIAYSIRSELWGYPGMGVWIASSGVETSKTKEALDTFAGELGGIGGGKPITADELSAAKTTILNSYPGEIRIGGSVASKVGEFWTAGLPLNEWPAGPPVGAISLETVNTVARKYARPENAKLLLLGDWEKIRSEVGDAVLLNVDGSPASGSR